MYINFQTIITAGGVLAAVIAIFSAIFAVYRWYLKQNRQDKKISDIEEENALICYGLSACLDGLIQLGANHNVPKVKDKLDKHLNQKAHEM